MTSNSRALLVIGIVVVAGFGGGFTIAALSDTGTVSISIDVGNVTHDGVILDAGIEATTGEPTGTLTTTTTTTTTESPTTTTTTESPPTTTTTVS